MSRSFAIWTLLVAAALLEVGGDAIVRKGILGKSMSVMASGMVILGFYGVAVNSVRWDFSKLLGVYVTIFAAISVLWGRFVFHDTVPPSTWIGLAVIVIGGLIIQFGG